MVKFIGIERRVVTRGWREGGEKWSVTDRHAVWRWTVGMAAQKHKSISAAVLNCTILCMCYTLLCMVYNKRKANRKYFIFKTDSYT